MSSADPIADQVSRYVDALPDVKRKALQRLYDQVMSCSPDIEPHFGYGMPAFRYRGHPLLYIGAAKAHCALYGSIPAGITEQLAGYKTSKGAIQFRPDKPLPAALVKAIVQAKCAEIEDRWGRKEK